MKLPSIAVTPQDEFELDTLKRALRNHLNLQRELARRGPRHDMNRERTEKLLEQWLADLDGVPK